MKPNTDYHPKIKHNLTELFAPFFDDKNEIETLLTSEKIKQDIESLLTKITFSGPSYFFVAELPVLKFHYFSDNVKKIIGHRPEDIISSNGDLFFQSFDGDFSLMNQISAEVFRSFHELNTETRKESSMNLYYNAINKETKNRFSVVQQNFPISFDQNGFFKGYIGIVTDISSYSQLKQPKATIVSKTGEILNEITSNILEEKKLSNRELEILKLISQDMTNEQVAEKLKISYHTVRTHRKNILKKTNFPTLEDAISYHKRLIE